MSTLTEFEQKAQASIIEAMPIADIDELPFGVIRLDPEGRVTFHSKREKALSGFGNRPVLGEDFFTQVAPCMNNPDYRGRIERARQAGMLDVTFAYIGDFNDAAKALQVHIQSAADGGTWIFMHRGP